MDDQESQDRPFKAEQPVAHTPELRVDGESLLERIAEFCRQNGLAESTFGRLAINDGKLMSRLRTGGRVTESTRARVEAFMASGQVRTRRRGNGFAGRSATPARLQRPPAQTVELEKSFRLYDNRQKYLLFVTTSSEKGIVADRAAAEFAHVHPRPPAVRVFDAGVGDGSVLTRLMRSMHHRFPVMPFYIVAKEIGQEDVRLTLEKMPDRFVEHPATVLVMTNLPYSQAPWLAPDSVEAASSLVWHELALTGSTGYDFERQISELQPFLAANWRARMGSRSGGPVLEKPAVLVIYRDDYRFLLDGVRPRRGMARADFDFVLASQAYRSRAPVDFKARKVIAPLARALGPGGRLFGVHSHGEGPGLEIVHRIWPDEVPFTSDRHELLRAVKEDLGRDARALTFHAGADARSLFRYEMHTLPTEIRANIGTSTLLAAWNAAVYVAQIEDDRLAGVIADEAYLEATREVLMKHGGLWFWDESYVISKRQE